MNKCKFAFWSVTMSQKEMLTIALFTHFMRKDEWNFVRVRGESHTHTHPNIHTRCPMHWLYLFLSTPDISVTSVSCLLSKYVCILWSAVVAWFSQWKYSSCWLIVLADAKLAKLKSLGMVSSVNNVERELDGTIFDSWLGLLLLDIFAIKNKLFFTNSSMKIQLKLSNFIRLLHFCTFFIQLTTNKLNSRTNNFITLHHKRPTMNPVYDWLGTTELIGWTNAINHWSRLNCVAQHQPSLCLFCLIFRYL